MIIKKYVCKRFAGIKDKEINFQDGLNVILGSNEAGKSTIVEGIHSVLFKSSKIGNRSIEDRDFRNKFMPIPTGDSIDGELVLCHSDEDYILSKEWGTSPFSQLTMPCLDVLKKEESILETLKDVLLFGEGTYSSIFFSKQKHIKEAVEKIIGNKEAINEVSSLLRKAIMELDGVPLDKLGNKIDQEIDHLLKRWDIGKNYPENNKGISNPYKVGFGEVVGSFYKKESIKLQMDEADKAEKLFNDIYQKLKHETLNLEGLRKRKTSMEIIENDMTQRYILEPKIEIFDNEMTRLSKINQKWPQNEMRVKQLDTEISKLNDAYQKLEAEKEQSKKVVERDTLARTMSKLDDLYVKLNNLKNLIATIKSVTKEDVSKLESNHNNMLKTEAMLKAGVIIGQLNYYEGKTDLIITKDFEDPIKVSVGESFRANGYIKFKCDDLFEIELKSGDIDVNELHLEYEKYKNNCESLLKELEVSSIEEAKLNKEKLDNYNRSIKTCNDKISELLGDDSYEILKEKLAAFGDLSRVRSLDVIGSEIKDIHNKNIDVVSEKKLLENEIKEWSNDYEDIDGLFDKILSIKLSANEIRVQLGKLAPLPVEYESTENFRKNLREIRDNYEITQASLSSLKDSYHECEKNLPNSTYEDLSIEYNTEENIFQKKLEKGQKLIRIKETFEATRLKMDEASFTPVIKTFSNYITLLTNGNYKTSEIDNDFNVKLQNDNQTTIPLYLLSSGTYDSVALALRLAILEYILGDNKGFLILDDCLVDLDPYRKEMAVKLINQFTNKHQVIFTTCSPDTAKLLGGHTIQI